MRSKRQFWDKNLIQRLNASELQLNILLFPILIRLK